MKIIIFILVLLSIGYLGYYYFSLDKNKELQQSLKDQDFKSAEASIRLVIADKMADEAKKYLYKNNNYFVSKSNNLCVSTQSLFSGLEKFTTNPVECVAHEHSFTARIKRLGSDGYYCADASGFYTILTTEDGYVSGVKCK
jgi:hypothetical protein